MTEQLSAADAQQKAAFYQRFLDTTLRTDLQKAQALQVKVQRQLSSYVDLARRVEALLKDEATVLEAMTTVGPGVHMNARADASRIFVNIGLGFHAQCSWEEALEVCRFKKSSLEVDSDMAQEQVQGIEERIKVVESAVTALQDAIAADA